MKLNQEMFKAYDIRTPANLLTNDLSERLSHALAIYFRQHLGTNKVVLCRDARNSGAAYLEQGIRIFQELGFEVIANPQVCSTSHFYFTCMEHDDAAGIMYGASHNPGEDTGRKIVGPGAVPIAMECGPEGGLTKIKELYLEDARMDAKDGGLLTFVNYMDEYIQYSMELAGVKSGSLSGVNILMDFLHGAAGEEFGRAFSMAGAELTLCNSIPDGDFPAGPPNPVVASAVAPSLEKIKNGGYDFAFFFDGDGDRMDVYAGNGDYLNPCFNMAALAEELSQIRQTDAPGVYACLKANPKALTRLSDSGLSATCIRNGHSQIKNALLQNLDYLGAVEESAHYYLNFPYRGNVFASENTLFFALLTARRWVECPQLYRDVLADQQQSFREREWGYKFPDEDKRKAALADIEKQLCEQGATAVQEMSDGTPLDATLIRLGLPIQIDGESVISDEWLQVAQRISQSEVGLARWEVSASKPGLVTDAVDLIHRVAKACGAGEKYVG